LPVLEKKKKRNKVKCLKRGKKKEKGGFQSDRSSRWKGKERDLLQGKRRGKRGGTTVPFPVTSPARGGKKGKKN